MYVCVHYACVCVCVCMCMCMCMCTYVYVCTCVCTCAFACKSMYNYACVVCMHVCMSSCMCVCRYKTFFNLLKSNYILQDFICIISHRNDVNSVIFIFRDVVVKHLANNFDHCSNIQDRYVFLTVCTFFNCRSQKSCLRNGLDTHGLFSFKTPFPQKESFNFKLPSCFKLLELLYRIPKLAYCSHWILNNCFIFNFTGMLRCVVCTYFLYWYLLQYCEACLTVRIIDYFMYELDKFILWY